MSLNLYDSATRSVRPFEPLEPLEPPRLRLFVCGPTVYARAHLGHAKTYTQFDLVVRLLRHRGHVVTYAQNITDVDDKIIERAGREGVRPQVLAHRYELAYLKDMSDVATTVAHVMST